MINSNAVHKSYFYLLKESVKEFGKDKGLTLSAALSYYLTIAFFPLLILIFVALGNAFTRETITEQIATFFNIVNPFLTSLLATAISSTSTNAFALTGVILALISVTALFSHIQEILSTTWHIYPEKDSKFSNFFKKRLLSLPIILALILVLFASIIASSLIPLANLQYFRLSGNVAQIVAQIATYSISLIATSLFFFALFKFSAREKFSDVWLWKGSIFTALLFFVGQLAISIYFTYFFTGSATSIISSFISLLIFFYYSSIIFVFGSEFTHVCARENCN